MGQISVHTNDNYTKMSNVHFRDKELSLKAKGLLSLMLSLPAAWDLSVNGLEKLSKDGRDSVLSGLSELQERGYVRISRTTDDSGRFNGVHYDVYEVPEAAEEHNEPPNTEQQTSTVDQFEEWWKLYGIDRPTEKGSCRTIFTGNHFHVRVGDEDRKLILEHTKRYVEVTPKQFRKKPYYYLLEEEWKNEIIDRHGTSTNIRPTTTAAGKSGGVAEQDYDTPF